MSSCLLQQRVGLVGGVVSVGAMMVSVLCANCSKTKKKQKKKEEKMEEEEKRKKEKEEVTMEDDGK